LHNKSTYHHSQILPSLRARGELDVKMMECRHSWLRCYNPAAGDSTGCKFTSERWLLDVGIIVQIWRNMCSNRIRTTSHVWTAYIPNIESSWLLYCTFIHVVTRLQYWKRRVWFMGSQGLWTIIHYISMTPGSKTYNIWDIITLRCASYLFLFNLISYSREYWTPLWKLVL